MKVRIHFSDGNYSYSRVEDDLNSRHARDVEVPESVVALWDAIEQAWSEMQKQLCALDNEWYDRHPQAPVCKHERDMDGTCHFCGEEVPE